MDVVGGGGPYFEAVGRPASRGDGGRGGGGGPSSAIGGRPPSVWVGSGEGGVGKGCRSGTCGKCDWGGLPGCKKLPGIAGDEAEGGTGAPCMEGNALLP